MYKLSDFENENFLDFYKDLNENEKTQEKIIKKIIINEIKNKMTKQNNLFKENLKKNIIYNFLLVKENKLKSEYANLFIEDLCEILNIYELTDFFEYFNKDLIKIDFVEEKIDKAMLLKIFNHLLKNITKSDNSLLRGKILIILSSILDYYHLSGLNKKSIIANNNYEINENIDNIFYVNFWKTIKEINNLEYDNDILTNLLNILNYLNSNIINSNDIVIDRNPMILNDENILLNQLNDAYFRKTLIIQIVIFFQTIKNDEISYQNKKLMDLNKKELKKLINKLELKSIYKIIKISDTRWNEWKENFFNNEKDSKSNKNEIKNEIDMEFLKKQIGFNKSNKIIDDLKNENLNSYEQNTHICWENIYDDILITIGNKGNISNIRDSLQLLNEDDIVSWRNLKLISSNFIKELESNPKDISKNITKNVLINLSKIIYPDLDQNYFDKLKNLKEISDSKEDESISLKKRELNDN